MELPLDEACDELEDVLVAAQELEERFRANGRPYLAMRARQLEFKLHESLDRIILCGIGWVPVKRERQHLRSPLAPVAVSPSRHETVFCPSCRQYDALVIPGGASVNDARCARCGVVVVTTRKKQAKAHAWARTFERTANTVALAAAGEATIEEAVELATFAAHIAFSQRLVSYGPEVKK